MPASFNAPAFWLISTLNCECGQSQHKTQELRDQLTLHTLHTLKQCTTVILNGHCEKWMQNETKRKWNQPGKVTHVIKYATLSLICYFIRELKTESVRFYELESIGFGWTLRSFLSSIFRFRFIFLFCFFYFLDGASVSFSYQRVDNAALDDGYRFDIINHFNLRIFGYSAFEWVIRLDAGDIKNYFLSFRS